MSNYFRFTHSSAIERKTYEIINTGGISFPPKVRLLLLKKNILYVLELDRFWTQNFKQYP